MDFTTASQPQPTATICITDRSSRSYFDPIQRATSTGNGTRNTETPVWSTSKLYTFTKQTMRTMCRRVRLIDPDGTPGDTYHVVLKPGDDVTPEAFIAAIKRQVAWMTRCKMQWLYGMEWCEFELVPHVHFIVNTNMPDFPQKAVKRWLKAVPFKANLHRKQWCELVKAGEGRRVLRYIGKEQTKADDFNTAAEECRESTGVDWSGVTPHGCSRGWTMLEEKKFVVSAAVGHEFRRRAKLLQIAKVDDPKRKQKIARSLCGRGTVPIYRRVVSEVTPFEVECITYADSWNMLVNSLDATNDKENQKDRAEEMLKYPADRSPAAIAHRRNTGGLMRLLRCELVAMSKWKRLDWSGHYDTHYGADWKAGCYCW